MFRFLLFCCGILFSSTLHAQTWNCGVAEDDDVVATLNNGVMVISGTGAMANFGANSQPWALQRCSVTKLIIGDEVSGIGSNAFNCCSGLTMVINHSEFPQAIDARVFNRVDLKNITLRVPTGSVEIYKAANIWKNFGVIEPIDPLEPVIEEQLTMMSLEEKIGQLFIAHLPGGAVISAGARALINNYHIGGFILFANHVTSIEQVQRLTAALQEASPSPTPLFIAIDEEGGRVSRIRSLFSPRIGTAHSIGSSGEPQDAYDAAHTIGDRLLSLGVNMNFAPVADIWTNPANRVIGDRAYGSEPEITGEMTAAAVRGFREAGVLSVIKHFPGHGDTYEDSHHVQAVYPHDMERFYDIEAYPFRRGIEAGADGVMVGHIATPQMHPEDPELPAVLSEYWIQDVLRCEWDYEGLVITDALDMRGLTRYYSGEEIVVRAFLAGADILLMPANMSKAVNAMLEACNDGRITEKRLDESVRRILRAKYYILRNAALQKMEHALDSVDSSGI